MTKKPRTKEYRRKEYLASKSRYRERNLMSFYGIGLAEYDRLFKSQDGRCAICRRPSTKNLYVDHDHATGVLRGLLCGPCNSALGMLCDSPFLLERAAEYLNAASVWSDGRYIDIRTEPHLMGVGKRTPHLDFRYKV